jgi:hypothetical protein
MHTKIRRHAQTMAAVVREDNLAVGMISTAARTVFSEVVEVVGVLAIGPTAAARFMRALVITNRRCSGRWWRGERRC